MNTEKISKCPKSSLVLHRSEGDTAAERLSLSGERDPEIQPDKSRSCVKRIPCGCCNETFANNYNLRRHISRAHGGDLKLINDTMVGHGLCVKCNHKFRQARYLRDHLVSKHNFPDTQQNYTFSSQEEFENWKKNMEKETSSSYFITCSKGQSGGYNYTCNRSGQYRLNLKGETRQRRLKEGGTVKTNMLCTSVIRYSKNSEGVIDVKFFPTHYGHDIRRKVVERPLKAKRKYTKRKRKNSQESINNIEDSLPLDDMNETTQEKEIELPQTISVMRREIISTLWEISCDVEKCTSKESLAELSTYLKAIRGSVVTDS